MNKTAACIKIIQILNCRDLVKASELADILEINVRNIKEYIKELEVAGYKIDSIRGKAGGYRIDRSEMLPSVKLTKSDKDVLLSTAEYLKNTSNYPYFESYEQIMGRILSSVSSDNEIIPVTMIDRYKLAMPKSEIQKRYQTLYDGIEQQLKCEINYNPASNKPKKHLIHPYKLFSYNGSWMVLAWSENICDFLYFKLNRILDLNITRNHFSLLKTYDESKYIDNYGLKSFGEYYHCKFKIKDLNTVILERIYGKNQDVEIIDDKTLILTCDMQNESQITAFVLSLGSKCEVLEPKNIKDSVTKEVLKLKELYGI